MITAAEMKTLQKQYRGEFSMSKTFAMKWPAEATKNQKMLLSRKKTTKKITQPYSSPQEIK